MAAKHCYRKGFLLLLFNFISTAALEKRFSDFKRCADEECSMLLCRGKAVGDFSGPDCRFLSFKKSETVYVYYKLSGKRTDIWAGSVGSHFGYFPKDFLAVNHNYTDKEIEVPAEETDFVCFDTGFDRFDNYDIGSLLSSSTEQSDQENEESNDQVTEDTKPLVDETVDSENQSEPYTSEDLNVVPDDESASLPHENIEKEPDTAEIPDETETAGEETENEQKTDSFVEIGDPAKTETKDTPTKHGEESLPEDGYENEPVTISEEAQIPELKTTLGTTFDAVITDAEATAKITPYEEEEGEEEKLEDHPEDSRDIPTHTPLLTSSEAANTPAPSLKDPEAHDDEPNITEEKNMWTSLGDAVFSVVTGGERTEQDQTSEEDDDEDDDEETAVPESPQSFEEIKRGKKPLTELPEGPDDIDPAPEDLHDYTSVNKGDEKTITDSEKLLFDTDDDNNPEELQGETSEPTQEPIQHQIEEILPLPSLKEDHHIETLDVKAKEEPMADKEEIKDRELKHDDPFVYEEDVDENATVTDQDVTQQALSAQELRANDSVAKDDKATEDIPLDQYHDPLVADVESDNHQPELEEQQIHEDSKETEDETNIGEVGEEPQELLEDENALFSQSEEEPIPETSPPVVPPLEPEYSDSVLRLTLLREHYVEEEIERFQKVLGLRNLRRVEAMFSDLDTELKATRLAHTSYAQDIDQALENIVEASENAILDEIERMLDERDKELYDEHQMDLNAQDEKILDDFQELAFSLQHKYSTASDSTPLEAEAPSHLNQDQNVDEHEGNVDDILHTEEKGKSIIPEVDDDNATVQESDERPTGIEDKQVVIPEVQTRPEVSVEEDGGHFNKNQDNQPSFGASDDMQKVPQATLENPLDRGLGVEVDHSHSESLDAIDPLPEFHEEEAGFFTTGMAYTDCIVSMMKAKVAEWTIVVISLLPEEWKPGETLYGCPWQAVVITALVGVLTFTLFFWRTVLAVKKREYLVDEKKLTTQIQALKKEKNDVLAKMTELQKQSEQLKEDQKQSAEEVSCTLKRVQDLESKILEAETRKEQITKEKSTYAKQLQDERKNAQQNETRIQKLEKSNEKLQLSRKKIQEAFAKTTILLDEAKIREDARNVQHKCLEKDYTTLKEENKSLKSTIKNWEDKHKELSEQIKVYQKSQKELEDSVVLKDHNVEVLSDLLADLDACDSQKGDSKVLANGEVIPDKKTTIKNRIKQMMDVSRVQTTLAVIEEERDRFMTKLLNEEKTRKSLEEQHQELEHSIATLKSEKSHVENQFKILQQKNEIMVEMYQQKENALQQRLTKEELDRRSKESMLSEVGGKATEAEEQVKVLRQRINEMEDQMKKTEEVYKEQIKEQENKIHTNWVKTRNAERALNQEKLESSKLREKLAVLTSQLNERRAPLFRPNSGQPSSLRQGDSYGPSPVSGGAPSPPLMIEGPRRPPSAPVGRRIDPYGPRPPSDPHGRYPDNKHIPGMDMSGPRSSSPANLDGSTQAIEPQINAETKAETKAEASTESPEPGPGSFLASPIRDSPGPGLHDPLLPPGPHGRLPPPGPYRAPRPGPGPYGPPPPNMPLPPHGPPLPPNGHPGMPMPGPMGGEFGPRPANGHAFHPRPGPGHMGDPRGPPPPHFRPPPPHHFGPMPPMHGVRGPMGPRPHLPPDMRFSGPRDLAGPPMDLPPGAPPHPAHGDVYGPPGPLHNSAGVAPGPAQDLEPPQDSARPPMAKP